MSRFINFDIFDPETSKVDRETAEAYERYANLDSEENEAEFDVNESNEIEEIQKIRFLKINSRKCRNFDMSAFLLDEHGNYLECIYFKNPTLPGGGIKMKKTSILMDLFTIPSNIVSIVFCAISTNNANILSFKNSQIQVTGYACKEEFAHVAGDKYTELSPTYFKKRCIAEFPLLPNTDISKMIYEKGLMFLHVVDTGVEWFMGMMQEAVVATTPTEVVPDVQRFINEYIAYQSTNYVPPSNYIPLQAAATAKADVEDPIKDEEGVDEYEEPEVPKVWNSFGETVNEVVYEGGSSDKRRSHITTNKGLFGESRESPREVHVDETTNESKKSKHKNDVKMRRGMREMWTKLNKLEESNNLHFKENEYTLKMLEKTVSGVSSKIGGGVMRDVEERIRLMQQMNSRSQRDRDLTFQYLSELQHQIASQEHRFGYFDELKVRLDKFEEVFKSSSNTHQDVAAMNLFDNNTSTGSNNSFHNNILAVEKYINTMEVCTEKVSSVIRQLASLTSPDGRRGLNEMERKVLSHYSNPSTAAALHQLEEALGKLRVINSSRSRPM